MNVLRPGEVQPRVRSANVIKPGRSHSWGPRVIGDPEVILLISGELEHARQGEVIRIRSGEVLLIEPGIQHLLRVAGGESALMSCIHFEPLAGQRFLDGRYELRPAFAEVTDTSSDYAVRDLFMRCAEVFDGYSRYRAALLSAIFTELWIRLFELQAGGSEAGMSRRMRAVLSFVRRNLASDLSRSVLASEMGVTPQYLNALFRKELGITPSGLVNRERVHFASRLMAAEGLSVKEAAARAGFNDQFYFSRVFKRIMHYPPSKSA